MENAIEFLKGQARATVTFSTEKWKNKMHKLVEEHPDECDITFEDSIYTVGHVPSDWVKINPPRKLTVEQKEELAERMRKLREVQDEHI